VQAAVNAGASINTVTLGSAPTAGNLLVAFSQGGNSGTLGAGWQTGFAADGGGINLSFTTWKIAGSGESATQSPFTTAQASCITIFELANATVLRPNYSDATTASATINADATGTQGLIIGAACAETVAVLPTSIAGATGGATATGTGNAVQLFSLASPLLGVAANLITVNYLAAHPIRLSACFIGGA
jgi:hypothetical protein